MNSLRKFLDLIPSVVAVSPPLPEGFTDHAIGPTWPVSASSEHVEPLRLLHGPRHRDLLYLADIGEQLIEDLPVGLEGLVRCRRLEHFECDITEITQMYSSKSPLHGYPDLDSLARAQCQHLLHDRSLEGIRALLEHPQVHITQSDGGGDNLLWRQWTQRLSLENSGGCHHFAAARWLARELREPTTIRGPLIEEYIDGALLARYRHAFFGFTLPVGIIWKDFISWAHGAGARYLEIPMGSPYVDRALILMPRGHAPSARCIRVLETAGFEDYLGRIERWACLPSSAHSQGGGHRVAMVAPGVLGWHAALHDAASLREARGREWRH